MKCSRLKKKTNLVVICSSRSTPCIKPGGPDAQDLVKYWDGEDPELLRPTIDRLERAGLIKIVQRLGGPRPDVPDAYRLSEVAGVHAL